MSHRTPSVVYVFADQWPAHVAGFATHPDVRTPNLDRFAEQSVTCRRAIANTPVCTPSRASLLTGLFPHRHGLFLNDAPLDPALHTMGEHFAAAGYDTGYVGKWHVDGHGRKAYIPPERRHGFRHWKVLECTHDYNASMYYAGDDPTPRFWDGYDALAQADDAAAFIRSADRPSLLMLSWGPPHNPYDTAPERFRGLYDPATLELRPNVPEAHAAATREVLAGFYAHCTALDEAFGRVLSAIDEAGLADDTIVVFTADHGDHLGAHYLAEKQSPLDEALRIPLLVRWPGELPVHANDTVIGVVDHFQTICGLAGLPQPPAAQGRDLSAQLRAAAKPEENLAPCASYHAFGTWPRQSEHKPVPDLFRARDYRGVRTERYTYCEDLDGPWLLFDNETDPYQLDNLVGHEEHAGLQAELAAKLHELLDRFGDDFRPGMEYVRRWGYEVDETGTIPTVDDSGGQPGPGAT
ncbi:MAG: sulfatase [Spirochaetota bacterium]